MMSSLAVGNLLNHFVTFKGLTITLLIVKAQLELM